MKGHDHEKKAEEKIIWGESVEEAELWSRIVAQENEEEKEQQKFGEMKRSTDQEALAKNTESAKGMNLLHM